MRTAIASALVKVLRGGRSGASLLHAGGRPMPQEGAALLLPRGPTAVPPPAAATLGMGGCEASSHSQSMLQAAGLRTPQEGGLALASLLPRLGATVPPPAAVAVAAAAAGMGSRRASSLSLLHAAGRRMPHKDGLAALLPRLNASAPCAMTWRFHQIAGLRSSAAAGEQIPCALSKKHITTVQNLYEETESLEANIKFVDNMLWVLGVLVLVAAVTLPEGVRNLWTTNSEQAIRRQAFKDIAERLKQVSSLQLDISREMKETAAAKRMAPVPVLQAATLAPSTTASDALAPSTTASDH